MGRVVERSAQRSWGALFLCIAALVLGVFCFIFGEGNRPDPLSDKNLSKPPEVWEDTGLEEVLDELREEVRMWYEIHRTCQEILTLAGRMEKELLEVKFERKE